MSNTQYHVAAGLAGIYAGITKPNAHEWSRKSDVTDEAINAVRDYMRGVAEGEGKDRLAYYWTTKDGKTVTLTLTVKEGKPAND